MVRSNYRWVSLAQSRYVAEHVPGAQFLELPGADSTPFWETPDLTLDHIEEFLTGVRRGGEPERMLVALLFSDVVGSTARAAELGDGAWRALLDRHDHILRQQVGMFAGKVVNQAGDGSLSTFENPRRAIDCALALGTPGAISASRVGSASISAKWSDVRKARSAASARTSAPG